MQTVLLIFIFLVTPTLLQNIPSYVPLCKRNDPDLSQCIINSVNVIRPYLLKGIPEMDIPQGEPLHFFNFSTTVDAVNTKLSADLWDQQAHKLMNFDLKSVNFDLDQLKGSIDIFFPKFDLEGQYKFVGKLFYV
ncbi:hypothetical protein RN001_008437 [Aquatica leii]|uniref:Hemolymph juvenile hormone binding protein n=1 Tax=Aquatica leii TaxID=1421715 RepID=A0AAN7S9N4_9COLE|nr:hypothetical protein RN001_008437 [Aquatica leii]